MRASGVDVSMISSTFGGSAGSADPDRLAGGRGSIRANAAADLALMGAIEQQFGYDPRVLSELRLSTRLDTALAVARTSAPPRTG